MSTTVAPETSVDPTFGLRTTGYEPDALSARKTLILTLAALIGVVIPYVSDTLAARLTSAQVVGTLFALDPVVGRS